MPTAFAAIGTALGASAGTATLTGVAATGLAAGAIGSNVQYNKQSAAADAAEGARKAQTRRQNVQALREAQIKRAMLTQQSVQSGTADSSGFQGGVSSLQSQLGSNLGFARGQSMVANRVNNLQQSAARTGAITSLVQSGLGLYGQTVGTPMTDQQVADGLTTQGGVNAGGTNSLYNSLGMGG